MIFQSLWVNWLHGLYFVIETRLRIPVRFPVHLQRLFTKYWTWNSTYFGFLEVTIVLGVETGWQGELKATGLTKLTFWNYQFYSVINFKTRFFLYESKLEHYENQHKIKTKNESSKKICSCIHLGFSGGSRRRSGAHACTQQTRQGSQRAKPQTVSESSSWQPLRRLLYLKDDDVLPCGAYSLSDTNTHRFLP